MFQLVNIAAHQVIAPLMSEQTKRGLPTLVRYEGAWTDLGTTACVWHPDGDIQAQIHPSGTAGAEYNCSGQPGGNTG